MYYNDTSEKPLSLIIIEGVPNLRGFGGYPCNGSISAKHEDVDYTVLPIQATWMKPAWKDWKTWESST